MTKVVSTQSWGSRLLSSFLGVIFGIVIVLGAFVLVFWNESHGLKTSQAITEAQRVLITVPSTPVDPNNNLRVVYLTGIATTNEELQDSLLDVTAKAIKLERKVEMYQWQENKESNTEKQLGGSEQTTTEYTYKQVWSKDAIDSNNFHDQAGHQNPPTKPIKSSTQYAKDVQVGDFLLTTDMVRQIDGATNIDLSKVNLDKITAKTNKRVTVNDDVIYIGENEQSPQVGDLKITLAEILPQAVSIIAQQTGNTLQPYQAKSGQSVSLIVTGEQSSQQMIHDALSQNKVLTWVLRFVALLMMIFGLMLIMGPVSVLADVIPFLGSLVSFGTGVVAFIFGIVLWALAISIAWFAVRPLWSLGLLAIVGIICFMLLYRKSPKKTR